MHEVPTAGVEAEAERARRRDVRRCARAPTSSDEAVRRVRDDEHHRERRARRGRRRAARASARRIERDVTRASRARRPRRPATTAARIADDARSSQMRAKRSAGMIGPSGRSLEERLCIARRRARVAHSPSEARHPRGRSHAMIATMPGARELARSPCNRLAAERADDGRGHVDELGDAASRSSAARASPREAVGRARSLGREVTRRSTCRRCGAAMILDGACLRSATAARRFSGRSGPSRCRARP